MDLLAQIAGQDEFIYTINTKIDDLKYTLQINSIDSLRMAVMYAMDRPELIAEIRHRMGELHNDIYDEH